jgi:hypothetical protein
MKQTSLKCYAFYLITICHNSITRSKLFIDVI